LVTGSGSITGDITINGTLAIGNSPGTMTFQDDLTVGGTAVSNFEFTDAALGVGTWDLAQGGAGAQTVTFGGTLNLLFSGGTYANSSVQIFDFESFSGNFTTVNFTGLAAGQSAVFDSTTGFVTVIPEPKAALIGGMGILALLRRRRD
jgi:fibronectin-binding autotransporter adhesin